MRIVRAHVGVFERLQRIWRYRELLVGLVRKELKVKYKNSVLGFAWSLLNPLMILVVYYFVFVVVMKSTIPQFPLYLLSGVLVWNLFSGSLQGATISVVSNSALVKKVSFPREVLPLAAVGASLVHFFLQGIVLAVALAAFQHNVAWSYVPLLIPATIAILLSAGALGLFLSAANAYMRDTQHFVEISLVAWFWATPIIYQYNLVQEHLHRWWAKLIYFANPLTPPVMTFQRALYARLDRTANPKPSDRLLPHWSILDHLALLGITIAVWTLIFLWGLRVFGRVEGNFAEEL